MVELTPTVRRLRAALAGVLVKSAEPELALLHRWLDTWTGVGLIAAGVERQGYRLSLSHIAEGECLAQLPEPALFNTRTE